MKRVSNGGEAIILIPPVLKPVEVEVPLAGIAPEIRNVPIAEDMPHRPIIQHIVYATAPRGFDWAQPKSYS